MHLLKAPLALMACALLTMAVSGEAVAKNAFMDSLFSSTATGAHNPSKVDTGQGDTRKAGSMTNQRMQQAAHEQALSNQRKTASGSAPQKLSHKRHTEKGAPVVSSVSTTATSSGSKTVTTDLAVTATASTTPSKRKTR